MDTNKMFGEPTDEQVAQFLKEFDEGEHQLSDEAKDALSTVGFRRSLQLSVELSKLKQDIQSAREALEEVMAHLPPQDGVSDPEGARWVGDGTILKCRDALALLAKGGEA